MTAGEGVFPKSPGDKPYSSDFNTMFYDWRNALLFGSGQDGTVTISGNTTLTKPMEYDVLTINTGVTLSTAGFPIKVKSTLTLTGTGAIDGSTVLGNGVQMVFARTIAGSGTIKSDGAAGANAAAASHGGSESNGNGTGASGSMGTWLSIAQTGGGIGGNSGILTQTPGGTGGAAGAVFTDKTAIFQAIMSNPIKATTVTTSGGGSPGKDTWAAGTLRKVPGSGGGGGGGCGGAGGAGGHGGDSGTTIVNKGSGNGATGGNPGGIIVLYSLHDSSATITLSAVGGVGGTGGAAEDAQAGVGGGGGGGSGGIIWQLTPVAYTTVLTGGAGGAAGSGTGITTNATAGSSGSSGTSIRIVTL